jgi:hypothetical protein
MKFFLNLPTSKTGYVKIASHLVWYQPCFSLLSHWAAHLTNTIHPILLTRLFEFYSCYSSFRFNIAKLAVLDLALPIWLIWFICLYWVICLSSSFWVGFVMAAEIITGAHGKGKVLVLDG